MSSCDKPIAECVLATSLGEDNEKAVIIKNLSLLISHDIWINNVKRPVATHSTKYFIWQFYEVYLPLQSIRMDNWPQRTI